jgi:hypothetical protein
MSFTNVGLVTGILAAAMFGCSSKPQTEVKPKAVETIEPGEVNAGLRAALAKTRSAEMPTAEQAKHLWSIDCKGELPGLTVYPDNRVVVMCPLGPDGRVAAHFECQGPPTKAKMYADGRFRVECPEETVRLARQRAEAEAKLDAAVNQRLRARRPHQ